MAFNKKTWANNQAGGTPLDASGLNDLENRIDSAFGNTKVQTLEINRDLTLTGEQTISFTDIGVVPHLIEAFVATDKVGTSSAMSIGRWDKSGHASCVKFYVNLSGVISTGYHNFPESRLINLNTSEMGATYASMESVTTSNFKLKWSVVGTVSGTALVTFVIHF